MWRERLVSPDLTAVQGRGRGRQPGQVAQDTYAAAVAITRPSDLIFPTHGKAVSRTE
jgi:hypothetical protein